MVLLLSVVRSTAHIDPWPILVSVTCVATPPIATFVIYLRRTSLLTTVLQHQTWNPSNGNVRCVPEGEWDRFLEELRAGGHVDTGA